MPASACGEVEGKRSADGLKLCVRHALGVYDIIKYSASTQAC